MDHGLGVFRVGLEQFLVLLERVVQLIVVEQNLGQCVEGLHVSRIHVGGAPIGGNGFLGLLQLVIGRAQGKLHFGRAVVDRDVFNHLDGMLDVAAFGIEAGQVEHDFFRRGLDGLRGLELVFSLFGVVLDGVKLAQNHVVLNAFWLQADELLILGDGQVQRIAGGCGGGIGRIAELAQVDASQDFVRVQVVGNGLEQSPGSGFSFMQAADAEVEIGQGVIQLRGGRVGIQRQLVLLNGAGCVLRPSFADSLVFIGVGQGQVVVSLGTVRRLRRSNSGGGFGRCGGCRSCAGGNFLRANRDTRQQDEESGGKRQPRGQQTKFWFHHPGDSAPCSPGGRENPFARRQGS